MQVWRKLVGAHALSIGDETANVTIVYDARVTEASSERTARRFGRSAG